jgi:hypothetical protein
MFNTIWNYDIYDDAAKVVRQKQVKTPLKAFQNKFYETIAENEVQ